MPTANPTTSCVSPTAADEVVVTGVGIISAIGCGWTAHVAGFQAGQSALTPITAFDASQQSVHIAGQAKIPEKLPKNQLTRAQRRRIERGGKLLIHAADEALTQARITAADLPTTLEIVLGTSAGAMAHGQDYYQIATGIKPSPRSGLAMAIEYQIPVQAGLLAQAFALPAPTTIISNACASGANAIGHAYQLVRSGRSQMVIAGGYDALCHLVFAGFDALKALSRTTPKPFDAHRDGLALGEGAAVLVLESRAHAEARGATILAVVAGYGMANDCHHLTQPHPQGLAALASMQMASHDANLSPNKIQYLNSHGTGTPLNDPAEAAAIAAWAGDATATLPVSSTKGAIGHLLGGAGAVEAAICLMAIREGFLPATAHVTTPDPCCSFELITQPRTAAIQTALTNSFGFGGTNASLIFRKHEDRPISTPPPPIRHSLTISGIGAVSPAGWGVNALIESLDGNLTIHETDVPPPTGAAAGKPSRRVRSVPRPAPDRALAGHPRLRRTTPISIFAAAAAMEALGPERVETAKSGSLRVGLIYSLLNGSVSFCGKFFGEVLANPATASPILFPETVFNAPASHLAAVLGITGPCSSLVGDSTQFLAAIDMASLWLENNLADLVLVIGAEEHDWLTATAADLMHFTPPLAEGAACIAIERGSHGISIDRLSTHHPILSFAERTAAAIAARAAIGSLEPSTLLVDDGCGHSSTDAATAHAWSHWTGPRISPAQVLGYGLSAACAWQCVIACHALQSGHTPQAVVASTGTNQRAGTLLLSRKH